MTSVTIKPGSELGPGLSGQALWQARAKSRIVMIATPIARDPVWQYTRCLATCVEFLPRHGVGMHFQFVVGSSNVAKARNELVAHFLASECTDLLFIDDDMEWNPGDILRLLASDKPVIGGVGRMRVQKPNTDPEVWCCRFLPDAREGLHQDDMGAVEVLGFGTAFMLINRSVFEAMIAAHPEWKRAGAKDWPDEIRAHYYEFFRHNREGDGGAEMSEDYVFCSRWRDMGGSIWIDPSIVLGHVGTWNYRGCIDEILEAAPAQLTEKAA